MDIETKNGIIEDLKNTIKEQQKEIERLEKLLENAVFTDTNYEPKPKRTIKLSETEPRPWTKPSHWNL